ncbi:MAG: TolB family protein [Myxococcota bacterium]
MRARWLSVLLVAAGCGGRIILDEVPSDPIAFVRQEPSKGLLNLETFREGLRIRLESPAEREARQREGRKPPRPRTSLMLLGVPSGEMRPVPDAGEGALPLDWSSDGSTLLLGRVRAAGGAVELASWNRQTGEYRRPRPQSSLGGATLGDGPILLAAVRRRLGPAGDARLGIVVYTAEQGVTPLGAAFDGTDPDLAPDGRTVLFVRPSRRISREPLILLGKLGEDTARPIGRGASPRFSRDGRWIVFVRRRNGDADVWMMRSDGTGKRVVASSGFDEEYPAISPQGRFVVYASARGSEEESQLFITRVSDGAETQLTQNGQNGRPIW